MRKMDLYGKCLSLHAHCLWYSVWSNWLTIATEVLSLRSWFFSDPWNNWDYQPAKDPEGVYVEFCQRSSGLYQRLAPVPVQRPQGEFVCHNLRLHLLFIFYLCSSVTADNVTFAFFKNKSPSELADIVYIRLNSETHLQSPYVLTINMQLHCQSFRWVEAE